MNAAAFHRALKRPTVAQARRREERLTELRRDLDLALRTGKPLTWSAAQRRPWTRLLAENGIDLLSATQLGKRKLRLHPGAKPAVIAYFGAPIQRWTPLFIVGRQTEPPAPAPLFQEEPCP